MKVVLALALVAWGLLPSAAQSPGRVGSRFMLGPAGSLTAAGEEAIDGIGSIKGEYWGEESYFWFLRTDTGRLPLEPKGNYEVTFDYRILGVPSEGFEVIFYSPEAGRAGDWLPGIIIDGRLGDVGRATLVGELGDYDDYVVNWSIKGRGSISIDNIKIVNLATGGILAVEDGEQAVSVAGEYAFPKARVDYRLDLAPEGLEVIDRATARKVVVPFGSAMSFDGVVKFSKDSRYIIRNVRSHIESYIEWLLLDEYPVDFVRTAFHLPTAFRDEGSDASRSGRYFPDKPDRVSVAYVNSVEFTAIGGRDPSFQPEWDKDGDGRIDSGVRGLPDYVDLKVFNDPWKNYVAAYWKDSWKKEIFEKIDIVASQHFDGVMLDVMTGYRTWKKAYPGKDVSDLRRKYVEFFKSVSNYAKGKYGSSFLVTANFDAAVKDYFPDLGVYADGGYYQNAVFSWDGSGKVDGPCLSLSGGSFSNPAVDFLKRQGLAILNMDHLGTGYVSGGLDFRNYDDRITEDKLLEMFSWAIESGSTPYVSAVFMGAPYVLGIPRFVRVRPGMKDLPMTSDDNYIIGSEADDRIATGSGDDVIYPGPGDNSVDGGAGYNTVFYLGKYGDYRLEKGEGGWTVSGKDGKVRDRLSRIQRLIFADRNVELEE